MHLLWALDHEPHPIEGVRRELEKAARMAPDDDHVWLAQADLATRSGRLAEAGDWLMRCEPAGPGDSAVWHARLEWVQAAGQTDEAMRAASHLHASALPAGRLLALGAWLAARNGNRRAEREALEKLVTLQPDEHAGLEQLADLAAQDGEIERLAELRRRKAARDAARDRYATLVWQVDPARHAAELARPPRRSADRSTPGPGGSWRPARIKPPGPRPRPRWLAWRRRSRRPRPVAGRSPTSSGRWRPGGEQRPRSPAP